MQIEKVDILEYRPEGPLKALQDKINELVDAYNDLARKYEDHYHLDTVGVTTTTPKQTNYDQYDA